MPKIKVIGDLRTREIMLKNAKKSMFAFWAFIFALCFMFVPSSQAVLTVDPTTIYSTVEGNFDAAALIGVAVAGVIWGIRYIKRGLRAA